MAKLFDRVGQATATTGTGTVTLGAVITDATNGDLATFTDMGAVAGDSVNYLIVDGNNWEIGTGALGGTAPGFTLSRTVAKSKIAGTVGITALTLSGTAKVYSVPANAVPNLWVMPSLGHDGSGVQLRLTNPAGTQSNALFSYGGLNLGDQVPINWGSSYQTANTGWDIGFSRNSLARTLFLDAQGGTGNRGDLILGNGYFYGGRTYDATNYSRLSLSHAGGTAGATIATEAGGTGTAGGITFKSDGNYYFGGITASFPKVKQVGAAFKMLLGDESSYADLTVNNIITSDAAALQGQQLRLQSTGRVAFSGGAWYDTVDTAINRNVAGVVEINNGTTGAYRDLYARNLRVDSGGSFAVTTSGQLITATHRSFLMTDTGSGGHIYLSGQVKFGPFNNDVGGNADTFVGRRAANVLAQFSGTSGQTFEVYGSTDSSTATPTTNYSRLSIKHAGGTAGATIATEAGGTGTAGPITISVPGGGFVKVRADGYTEVVALKSDTINASAFDLRTTGFKLDGTIAVTWGASYGTPDVGLYRTAPGVVEVNNGTAGTYRAIKAACFIQAQGTLTSGATVAWDVQANQSAILTLGVNATLSNPTNMVAGTTYMLVVKQDATGSRTLAYGTAYKWPGGAAPVLSTAANATDVLTFIYDGTSMLGVAQKAFA